jgi:MmyB-like transcription regulator ligand binding domain
VRPSAQVLDALAAALRMSAAERRYLDVLAYGPGANGAGPAAWAPGGPGASAPPEQLDPAVAGLVQRLDPFPTLVKGRRWDVLAANPAARELFCDWSAEPAGAAGSAGPAGPAGPAGATWCAGCSLPTRPGRSTWSGSRRPGRCPAASGFPPPGTRTTPTSAYSHVVLQVADHPDQTLVTYSPATPLTSGR